MSNVDNVEKRKQQKNRVLQAKRPNTKYTRLLLNKKKQTFMQELKKDGLLLECVVYAFIFLFIQILMPTLYLTNAINNSTIEGLIITSAVVALLILLCFRCFWIGWSKPKTNK